MDIFLIIVEDSELFHQYELGSESALQFLVSPMYFQSIIPMRKLIHVSERCSDVTPSF